MVDWWGNVDLSYKFAIVLAGSIALTFIAGFLKLWITNRWTARMQLKEDMERANNVTEKAGVRRKELGVGDLFGVRAIEKGFYGGVSQVDVTTPSRRNMKTSSTESSPTDSHSFSHGTTDSIVSSFNQPEDNQSGASTPNPSNGAKTKANPPRLQPSQAEMTRNGYEDVAVNMSLSMPPSPLLSNPSRGISPLEPNRLTKPGRVYDPQPAERRDSYKQPRSSTPTSTKTTPATPTADGLRSATLNLFPSTQPPRMPMAPRPGISRLNSDDAVSSSRHDSSGPSSTRSSSPEEKQADGLQLRPLSENSDWANSIVNDYINSRQSRQGSAHQSPRMSRRSSFAAHKSSIQPVLEDCEPSTSPECPPKHTRRISLGHKSRSSSSSSGRTPTQATNSKRLGDQAQKSSKINTARKPNLQHYDPSSGRQQKHPGAEAGAAGARDVEAPLESPFSDAYKSHSVNTSVDSTATSTSKASEMSREEEEEEELQRDNERMISQWKARELKKTIAAAKVSGTIREERSQNSVARQPTGRPAPPSPLYLSTAASGS